MDSFFVVGIGEVLWDIFPSGRKLGGAPSNFAFHLSQFGFNSYAVSAIGNDTLGDEIVDMLSQKTMMMSFPKVDFPTGTVNVSLHDNGIPEYEIVENVAWDNIPFTPELEEIAKKTICVCFGSLAQRSPVSRETIHRFIKLMPDLNRTIKLFDINLRQSFYNKEIIEQSLNLCNMLKINDEELHIVMSLLDITKNSQINVCHELLSKYNLKYVILTCGETGSFVITQDNHYYLPTPEVEVVDTVGAGDSFTAAFCGSLLNGKDISKAHQSAVNIAAYVCTQNGAMPNIPYKMVI